MDKEVWDKITSHIIEVDDLEDPEEINKGWCMIWAAIAHAIYPQSRFWDSDCAHVWIEIDGKHYDSVNFGVPLEEFTQRYREDAKPCSPEYYAGRWEIDPDHRLVTSFFTKHSNLLPQKEIA